MPPPPPTPNEKNPASNPTPVPSGAPDPKSFLLPKKEGPSADSAQRVNAGALLEQEVHAAEVGLGGDAPASPAPQPATSAPTPKPAADESLVRPLETYSGDVAQVIEGGGVSAVSIAAAEMARGGEADATPADPDKWKRLAYWIGGGVLVLAALGLIAFLVLRTLPRPIEHQSTFEAPFMQVDSTVLVQAPAGTTRTQLMQSLESARESMQIAVGLIAELYVGVPTTTSNTPDLLPAQSLLPVLSPDIPQELLRTIEPVYLLGVHSYDQNQTFLIMRVDSYEQAYAGMLAWEPYLYSELSPLFTRTPSPSLPAPAPRANDTAQATSTGIATTTATSTQAGTGAAPATPIDLSKPASPDFADEVVDNHDARVLVNSQGDILMLWTFLDRSTVLITTNANTLTEVVRRLDTGALVPQPQ